MYDTTYVIMLSTFIVPQRNFKEEGVMGERKYEFCITATYEEYYDVWASSYEEAKAIFMLSPRLVPDEIKCLTKDRESAVGKESHFQFIG
jgi:hypothetical protein